jgi:protocatechuate 3,4-dioxygenase beta subunit
MRAARYGKLIFVLMLCVAWPARADHITGRVLDPQDNGVANAEVFVVGDDATAKAAARTDAEGRFALELESREELSDYYGRAIATAPNFAPGGVALRLWGENVIHLDSPTTLRGRVLDDKQRPLAGAKIAVFSFSSSDDTLWIEGVSLGAEYSAISDQDGRWKIENAPKSLRATIEVRAPGFVLLRKTVTPDAESTWPLRIGAAIEGRIVGEDGKPVGGVRIFALRRSYIADQGWSEATSQPDGAFLLDNLPAGSFDVMADAPEGFVVAAREGVIAHIGETRRIEDLVLSTGALVEGVASDEKGAPVAGLRIGDYGPHRPKSGGAAAYTRTDKDGRYRLRVAPGANTVYPMSTPLGLVQVKGIDFTIQKGETKTIPFHFEHGLRLKGTVADEAGKPVGESLLLFSKIQTGHEPLVQAFAKVDARGRWETSGFTPGKWQVDIARKGWRVLMPGMVTLPDSGEVRVVVGRIKSVSLAAKVVASQGAPLAGVRLLFQIGRSLGGGKSEWYSREATSDAQGRFALDSLDSPSWIRLSSAQKDGFFWTSGGNAEQDKAGRWTLSNVIMAPLDRTIAGRVVDENGQPVAGAQVFATEAGSVAVSDAAGHFVLSNLPPATLTVIAATAGGCASHSFDLRSADAQDARLALHKAGGEVPQDEERAFSLLGQVWEESAGTEYYARRNLLAAMTRLDPERAQALGGETDELTLATQIALLARDRPDEALRWGVSRLGNVTDPQINAYLATQLGLAAVGRDRALAEEMFARARDAVAPVDWWGAMRLSSLASLATQLQQPDAKHWLDAALDAVRELAKQNPGTHGVLSSFVEDLARFNTANAEYALAQLEGAGKADALVRAIPQVARRDDPAALELLKQLGNSDGAEDFNYSRAAVSVVRSLGKRDPKAALELARSVTNDSHRPAALAAAAACQDDATAPAIWREAADAAYNGQNPVTQLAGVATRAGSKFPDLAREFLLRAKALLDPKNGVDFFNRSAQSLPDFAYAYAPYDPATSRRLLEWEWAKRIREAQSSPDENGWLLVRVATAMAAVDFDRALEMAHAIPIKTIRGKVETNERFDAERKLAQYLTLFPVQRRAMNFGRWNASDTWDPADDD